MHIFQPDERDIDFERSKIIQHSMRLVSNSGYSHASSNLDDGYFHFVLSKLLHPTVGSQIK